MAVLYSWQKISRVIPGRPFGDGRDGTLGGTSLPAITAQSCSGAATGTSLTLGTAAFADNDIILIHQTRGAGAGQWEINKIISGGNTTTLGLSKPLQYDFLDSGITQAQAIKIPLYSNISVSGCITAPTDWNQNIGGLYPIAASGDGTIAGTLELNGAVGTAFTSSGARYGGGHGGGYYGGNGYNGNGDDSCANQGEGTAGAGAYTTAANGNGGGAGGGSGGGGGGGGGNGAAGTNAEGSSNRGVGGNTAGTEDLTTMTFGGGGGGASYRFSNQPAGGGSGGGILAFFMKNADLSGLTATVNGASGGSGAAASGGSGAGGCILVVCKQGTFGSGKLTATGGAAATGGYDGGAGAIGRIAIHHSKTIVGTTTPTFTDVTDSSLVDTGNILNLTTKTW